MFGIGGGELIVVALVAILLFGNEELPKNMRKIVKAWNDFRGMSNDLQRSWMEVRDQVTRDLLTDEHGRPHSGTQTSLDHSDQHDPALAEVHHQPEQPSAVSETTEAEGPHLPVIQPAQGALAQGELTPPAADDTQLIPPPESGKST